MRRLHNPDEILMFCVDSSASMGSPTDFEDAKGDGPIQQQKPSLESQAGQLVSTELNHHPSLDDTRETLVRYESFDDIIGIVMEAPEYNKEEVTGTILDFLTSVLSSEIIEKSENLEKLLQSGLGRSTRAAAFDSELRRLKLFCAGIKRHNESLRQFLRWRATCVAQDAAPKWTWSLGDPMPVTPPSETIPILAADITELPHHLRCPISC